ncbi:putative jacalin-like lectin domain-containing protein [Rosa chinensis]|uniref:Putative jacalin-like lectin domain-containing protein n=1 Tax=Rosa chinensis TaxID=74649 RepID=A0A2P6PYT9_ROSCH|nr:putative jacalin-like lectin domain-containing protein [Rosa chinensis]
MVLGEGVVVLCLMMEFIQIIFDYPYEILTHITGTYGPAMGMGPNVIKSLTIHTTKKKHGPYGEEQGTRFSTQAWRRKNC